MVVSGSLSPAKECTGTEDVVAGGGTPGEAVGVGPRAIWPCAATTGDGEDDAETERAVLLGPVPETWVPETWEPLVSTKEGEVNGDSDVVPPAVAGSVDVLVEASIDRPGVPLLGSSWLTAAVGAATEDAGGPVVAAL